MIFVPHSFCRSCTYARISISMCTCAYTMRVQRAGLTSTASPFLQVPAKRFVRNAFMEELRLFEERLGQRIHVRGVAYCFRKSEMVVCAFRLGLEADLTVCVHPPTHPSWGALEPFDILPQCPRFLLDFLQFSDSCLRRPLRMAKNGQNGQKKPKSGQITAKGDKKWPKNKYNGQKKRKGQH